MNDIALKAAAHQANVAHRNAMAQRHEAAPTPTEAEMGVADGATGPGLIVMFSLILGLVLGVCSFCLSRMESAPESVAAAEVAGEGRE